MSVHEINLLHETELHRGTWDLLHQAWVIAISGTVLALERYGNRCGWSEVILKKDGKEVYRISKPWGNKTRTELFFGQQTRTYDGDQFSFVEYIDPLASQGRMPSAEEYVRLGLSEDVERQYRSQLERILADDTSVQLPVQRL